MFTCPFCISHHLYLSFKVIVPNLSNCMAFLSLRKIHCCPFSCLFSSFYQFKSLILPMRSLRLSRFLCSSVFAWSSGSDFCFCNFILQPVQPSGFPPMCTKKSRQTKFTGLIIQIIKWTKSWFLSPWLDAIVDKWWFLFLLFWKQLHSKIFFRSTNS